MMTSQDTLAKTQQTEVTRRGQQEQQYYQPPADVVETADTVVLQFDMPGVGKDDVEVTVDKDLLTVVGKAAPEAPGRAVYRETYVGDYRRQFTLSADLDPNTITATMNAGVLTLEIGKAERAKPRKIAIDVG
jgi:HSP20 family molecular chaperone IbpA